MCTVRLVSSRSEAEKIQQCARGLRLSAFRLYVIFVCLFVCLLSGMARFLSAVSVTPQPKTSEKATETNTVLATVIMKMSDTQTSKTCSNYQHEWSCALDMVEVWRDITVTPLKPTQASHTQDGWLLLPLVSPAGC